MADTSPTLIQNTMGNKAVHPGNGLRSFVLFADNRGFGSQQSTFVCYYISDFLIANVNTLKELIITYSARWANQTAQKP